jgi:large subunit ribosomal protein L1
MSKRLAAIREKVERGRLYDATDALRLLKETANPKFDETVEAAVNLGVDPRKSDQLVRGSTVLPNGTGKEVRVAVFASGPSADEAREAGADLVGLEDLAEKVRAGELEFDIAIATPDAMRIVGQLGRILGPRGLMPNPKTGTVAEDVTTAVANAKGGQVQYRTDRAGIIHCPIGKLSFEADALQENLAALVSQLVRVKPAASKGIYLQKVTVSSTMGPGVTVDKASLSV